MKIINAEFVRLFDTLTIRVSNIAAINTNTGSILVDIGSGQSVLHIGVEEAKELESHWIAVTSARLGIYHEPVVVPTVAPPAQVEQDKATTIGTEEGAVCGRGDPPCEGVVTFKEVRNCACHINPPCAACSESWRECDDCGWDEEEG